MNKRLLIVAAGLVLLTALPACGLETPAAPATTIVTAAVEPTGPATTIVTAAVEPTGPALAATPTAQALLGDLDALDRTLFAELRTVYRVFAESGDQIWDGLYRLDQWPLLFVRADDERRPIYGYLVNASDPLAGAVPLSSNPEGLPPVYRITEGLDAFADPGKYFDTFYPLGDFTLLAIRYQAEGAGFIDPGDSIWLPYVVHEGFHRYQVESWDEPQEWDREVDYPLATENLALALLEHEILLAGLDAPKHQALQYLRLFVTVRAERMARYPAVRMLDNPQEWREGTADYVHRRFLALAGIPDVDPLWVGLDEPFSVQADRVYTVFTRDRFYASGSAVCILMDRAGMDWRPAIAEGKTPYDILAGELSLSEDERADLLAQAMDRFDYPELLILAERLPED